MAGTIKQTPAFGAVPKRAQCARFFGIIMKEEI